MTGEHILSENAAGFVEVLVAGMCSDAEMVFERILRIPTLPWMRGSLILIRLDAFDDRLHHMRGIETLGPIERTIHLPIIGWDSPTDAEVRGAYHHVLRACARLGMIAGRGVVANTNWKN